MAGGSMFLAGSLAKAWGLRACPLGRGPGGEKPGQWTRPPAGRVRGILAFSGSKRDLQPRIHGRGRGERAQPHSRPSPRRRRHGIPSGGTRPALRARGQAEAPTRAQHL